VIALLQITEGPEDQHGFQTTSAKSQTSRMAIFFMYIGRLNVNCKFWKQIEVMLHDREHCDLCLFAGVDTVILCVKTPA
jgi:hypothetical protein